MLKERLKLATHSWWPWDRWDLIVASTGAALIYFVVRIMQWL